MSGPVVVVLDEKNKNEEKNTACTSRHSLVEKDHDAAASDAPLPNTTTTRRMVSTSTCYMRLFQQFLLAVLVNIVIFHPFVLVALVPVSVVALLMRIHRLPALCCFHRVFKRMEQDYSEQLREEEDEQEKRVERQRARLGHLEKSSRKGKNGRSAAMPWILGVVWGLALLQIPEIYDFGRRIPDILDGLKASIRLGRSSMIPH